MNFEQNKKALLNKLSSMHRDNVLKKKEMSIKIKNSQTRSSSNQPPTTKQKKEILVFGKESFFMKNFINTLKSSYEVSYQTDVDKACEYCLDKIIDHVLLDMDEPTDWRISTDVFTTIKTINPTVNFILLTGAPEAVPVKTLQAQKAIVVMKPVSMEELYQLI
jgi:PleD family two-component response regulator